MAEYGDDAVQAVVKEMTQILKTKKVGTPVHKSTLTPTQRKRIIRSSCFLKTKFDAQGNFDKLKARLLANGAQQDPTLYPDRSSPTALLQSIFMVLTIAAAENRTVAAIDIGGAYLNAPMTGEEVLMELDSKLSAIAAQVCPEVQQYIAEDNKLIIRLDQALYGCVQSAKLWYDELTTTLRAMGYSPNEVDPCVMNKSLNGKQCALVIFVDDILVLSQDQHEIDEVVKGLKEKYAEIQFKTGNDFSYLGMHILLDNGKATVRMEGFVEALLEEQTVTKCNNTPANG